MIKILFAHLLFILVSFFPCLSQATQVEIFDVGHGNCILVTHADEGLIVDAGSKGSKFNALYDKMFGPTETRYLLSEKSSDNKQSDSDDVSENWEELIPFSLPGSDTEFLYSDSDSEETETPPFLAKFRKSNYEDLQITKIRESLNKLSTIKIVISHSHEDHYNYLPLIFNSELESKISTFILGGLRRCYPITIKNWFCKIYENNEKIKFFFTGNKVNGMQKGERQNAFNSFTKLSDYQTEIIQALQFTNDTPQVQVLAMNASCKEGRIHEFYQKQKNICRKPNANSIVLRIIGSKTSIILPGDANSETWNFIKEKCNDKNISSDYFLLPHHGSQNGVDADILNLITPKMFILSAGCHERYHLPEMDALTKVIKHPSLENDAFFPLSCYNNNIKTVIDCDKKFGSTLDDGNMIITLDNHST